MIQINDRRFLVKDGTSKTFGPTLLASLGYFWNTLFGERGTVAGYTQAASEELIQRYYDLIDVVAGHSVYDIPVFRRERWTPLKIRRSELTHVPLELAPQDDHESWTIGAQSGGEYNGITFLVGKYKLPANGMFVARMPAGLRKFSAIFNRVLRPSLAFTIGADIRVSDDCIYFSEDPFGFADVSRHDMLNADGSLLTYVDRDGNTVTDQELILWIYHGEFEASLMAENFGPLFNVVLPSTEDYKRVLAALMKMTVAGPSISALKAIASAFTGTRTIQEADETVERTYTDGVDSVVVTDRNVYRTHATRQPLRQEIVPGYVMHAGDSLTDAVAYHDFVTSGTWWRHVYSRVSTVPEFPQITIPSQLFLGSYRFGVVFENDFRNATYTVADGLTFPVLGHPDDVAEFQRVINLSQAEVMQAIGLAYPESPATSSTVRLNPLDFVFTNFFKTSVGLVKMTFRDTEQASVFFDSFNAVRPALPVNAYLLFFIETDMPADHFVGTQISPYNPDLATVNAYGWITNASSSTTPVSRRFYTAETIDVYSSVDGDLAVVANTAGYGDTPTIPYCAVSNITAGQAENSMAWTHVSSPTVTFTKHTKVDGVTYSKSATIESGSFHSHVKVGWFVIYIPDLDFPDVGERLRITSISDDGTTLTFEPAVRLEISEVAESDTTDWAYEKASNMANTPVLFLNQGVI